MKSRFDVKKKKRQMENTLEMLVGPSNSLSLLGGELSFSPRVITFA
jgi:hypothetical protein